VVFVYIFLTHVKPLYGDFLIKYITTAKKMHVDLESRIAKEFGDFIFFAEAVFFQKFWKFAQRTLVPGRADAIQNGCL